MPRDATLGLCAGGVSAALEELLALLGATQDSFAAIAAILERLTLVTVCPNTVRAATEDFGAALQAHDQAVAAAAEATVTAPPLRQAVPAQLVVSLDGVLVHLHAAGWKEVKLGAVYTTALTRSWRRNQEYLRAVDQSFVVDLGDATQVGAALWREAAERGALTAGEVVVIGDRAHWIWGLADTYFPGATQIVDWYHALGSLWKAANALLGGGDHGRAGLGRDAGGPPVGRGHRDRHRDAGGTRRSRSGGRRNPNVLHQSSSTHAVCQLSRPWLPDREWDH